VLRGISFRQWLLPIPHREPPSFNFDFIARLDRLVVRRSRSISETEDALDALAHNSLFNIVDYATMWKVDFIIKQPTPFDASFWRLRI